MPKPPVYGLIRGLRSSTNVRVQASVSFSYQLTKIIDRMPAAVSVITFVL